MTGRYPLRQAAVKNCQVEQLQIKKGRLIADAFFE